MDIMLDLETLGKKPGALVLSIGAKVFSRRPFPTEAPGATFYANINIFSSLMVGLTIDPDTVGFWRKIAAKDSAAIKALVTPEPRQLPLVMADFVEWFHKLSSTGETIYVWAKSPTFDCAIWEAACEAVGVGNIPWEFRAPRDVRTLLDLAGIDEKAITATGTGRVQHSALDDCDVQILQVQAAYAKLFPPMMPAPAMGFPQAPNPTVS